MSRIITNPDPKEGETSINIYGYTPSLSVGLASSIIFAILAIGHAVLMILSRKGARWYHFLLFFGSAWEVVGYAFRTKSHYNPFLLNPFVIQYFFIVCAPVFFSATVYLGVSLLIRAKPSTAEFLPRWATPRGILITFVIADTLTIIMQVAGAALVGAAYSAQGDGREFSLTPDQANSILLAGLCIQCFFTLIFIAIPAAFALRSFQSRETDKSTRTYTVVLFFATILIFMRALFRLAESAEGSMSKIMQKQDLFLIELIPVIVAVAMLTAAPPHWLLRDEGESKVIGKA